jgi:iron complex transport system permease protein
MTPARLTPRTYLATTLVWATVWAAVVIAGLALGAENIWTKDADTFNAYLAVRLYSVMTASVVGAALALAGLALQALLRNPLADPFVLGVSGGASLAVILASLLLGLAAAPVFGFVGALGTMGLVYLVAQRRGRIEPYTLLLTGVVANAFYAAAIMLVTVLAGWRLRGSIAYYMMGSISSFDPNWPLVVAVGVLAAGTAVLFALMAKGFNLVAVGEDTAGAMGVPVHRLRVITFIAASLVTGASVALAGPIGFVGLICPHLLRMALGPDYRRLVPASFFFGAAFLAAADLATRLLATVSDQTLPVGVLTAMAGVPFFVYLLRVRWHRTAEIR